MKHPDVCTLIGTCDGSSMSGCPKKYSSDTIYSTGDHIAICSTDSSDSDVGTLFECKSGEESVYNATLDQNSVQHQRTHP